MFFDSLAFHRLRVRVAQYLFTPPYFSDIEQQSTHKNLTWRTNMALLNFENASMNFADMFTTFVATTDSKETHLRYKGIE